MFLEMADDELNGGTPFELALDLRRDAALLAARVDLELVIGLQSGSRDRRSTTGTADTRRAGSKLWSYRSSAQRYSNLTFLPST
jgi:hypothetical protein